MIILRKFLRFLRGTAVRGKHPIGPDQITMGTFVRNLYNVHGGGPEKGSIGVVDGIRPDSVFPYRVRFINGYAFWFDGEEFEVLS